MINNASDMKKVTSVTYLGYASRPCVPFESQKIIIPIIFDCMHGVSLFYYENQQNIIIIIIIMFVY